MNYSVNYTFTGKCPDIDLYEKLELGQVLISEDLRDAIPYLYQKHFGIPYAELGWWLEPGAKEWLKEIENKWMHNQLDLSEVYKDKEFLKELCLKYSNQINEDTLDDLKDEFEDKIQDELDYLDRTELVELYEYDDKVNYIIEDHNENIIAEGYVYLPDLDDEDEEDD